MTDRGQQSNKKLTLQITEIINTMKDFAPGNNPMCNEIKQRCNKTLIERTCKIWNKK